MSSGKSAVVSSIPDIDLDFFDRSQVMALFPNAIKATQMTSDETKMVRHETGVYFQNIPSEDGMATYPYKIAEELGFMKIDFLSNKVYEGLTAQDIDGLLEIETDWSWYLDERFYLESPDTPTLVHIGGYYDLVKKYPPQSLDDIAMLIALIRPGKKTLVGRSKEYIMEHIWEKEIGNKYTFKKSHSYAYGLMVTLHAKLIAGELEII